MVTVVYCEILTNETEADVATSEIIRLFLFVAETQGGTRR